VIVHLLEFRVVPGHEAEVAAFLRHFPPATGAPHGLVAHCVGRRLGRQQQEYILITIWQGQPAFGRGINADGLPAHLTPKSDLLGGRSGSAFEVLASHLGEGFAGARILRIYRGAIAARALEMWQTRAQEQAGVLAESAGLRAVLAGVRIPSDDRTGEVPVMAISAWRDWNAVLTATGGHIDRLVQETELGDLEKPSGVVHYQLLDRESSSAEAAEAR